MDTPITVAAPVLLEQQADPRIERLAVELGLVRVSTWLENPQQLYLRYEDDRLVIGLNPNQKIHPVAVDFPLALKARHRGKELLIKALGGAKHRPRVVDATAGLGRDSFVMASHCCEVVMCERNAVVAALLADGIARGGVDISTRDIVGNMHLAGMSAQEYLQGLGADDFPDVVYLDPMFPMSKKTALVKKEMRLFHSLVGEDEGGEALLALALQRARHRVVVKRPPKASYLGDLKPQLSVAGKAVRFDIYTLKAFGK